MPSCFCDGWAPLMIFAGGLGVITRHLWNEPEADQFAAIAVEMGVPRERILIENRSTNTGENVLFTKRLLADKGLEPRRFIVVQKPYMERRSYATFKKVWPEKDLVVTSPQVSMDEYVREYSHDALSPDDVVGIMVGDLQRIRLYPAKGFQIHQEIPDEVWRAYEELVNAGYDKYPHMNITAIVKAKHACRIVAAATMALSTVATEHAQSGYRPSAANLAAREWFQDARFGLFVHWGVYSVLGDGEWVMNNKQIPIAEYEKLPAAVQPDRVRSRPMGGAGEGRGHEVHHHHEQAPRRLRDVRLEGRPTTTSSTRTPYRKDVLKLLADECHKQGIKLFFYHSQLDWHHPDYFPRGRTGRDAGPARAGRAGHRYLDYMDAQLTRAADQLRRDRRHLVRRLVGQARRRLAARARPTR